MVLSLQLFIIRSIDSVVKPFSWYDLLIADTQSALVFDEEGAIRLDDLATVDSLEMDLESEGLLLSFESFVATMPVLANEETRKEQLLSQYVSSVILVLSC